MENATHYTAFAGHVRIATGPRQQVIETLKRLQDAAPDRAFLLFDDESGQQLEVDLQGSLDDVLARELPSQARGPGRPKLGVVSREVSLLPRHWDWLEQQPSGISAALRRLVEDAAKRAPGQARAKRIRGALSRVMTALAGNLPDYEEATRALFAGDQESLEKLVHGWPKDLRSYVTKRAREAVVAEQTD
jgi:hypothetical protein